MVKEFLSICSKTLEEASEGTAKVIDSYQTILDGLATRLTFENITPEERKEITNDMVMIADRIDEVDRRHKEHNFDVMKTAGEFILGALVIVGGVFFAMTSKGSSLPQLEDA